MSKSRVEQIYDALEKHCDMSRYWNHPEFHCFDQFPQIVWIWPVTHAIESQLSNGGLGQLLWNTFANWRKLERAEQAYKWLQFPVHSAAIQEFKGLFECYEPACLSHLDQFRLTNDFGEFGQWMMFANTNLCSDKVDLFCNHVDLDERKEIVMRRNFNEILAEIKAKSPS